MADRDYRPAMMRANSNVNIWWPHLPTTIRSESTTDVTGYFRPHNIQRSRPLWLSEPYPKSSRPLAPFRRNRNASVTDLYRKDSYYFFSPLYRRSSTGTRPFASDIGPHPYSYWARYNGYGYDEGHPGYYRTYFYPVADYFG
uniref:Uncharacterized protein n=1 Tax=Globodera rostochiensis TaxID=31243 RepID=A0A914GTR7_GLORO